VRETTKKSNGTGSSQSRKSSRTWYGKSRDHSDDPEIAQDLELRRDLGNITRLGSVITVCKYDGSQDKTRSHKKADSGQWEYESKSSSEGSSREEFSSYGGKGIQIHRTVEIERHSRRESNTQNGEDSESETLSPWTTLNTKG
jgi:hypothetical protein